VYRGRDETAGLPNAAVEAFEDKRLIRAEQRAGALWYELTHDRLITPIRASDQRVAAHLRRRRNRVLIALLAAALAMAAAFGVALGWFIESASEQELRPAERLALARRFAPLLRFDSAELSVPTSRSAYLSVTHLKEQEGDFVRLVNAKPRVNTLPQTSCGAGCSLFLDVRGAEPDPPKRSEGLYDAIENRLLRSGARPTVYYHVTRYNDTDEYAVQYWFLYLFNYRVNEHESDWEQITVHLGDERQPIDVYYSAYDSWNIRAFAKVAKRGHPVVYPARGSHTNYFEPGRHLVPVACTRVIGSFKHCLRGGVSVIDVSDAQGAELRLGDYDLAVLDGPVYVGSYGSGTYAVLTRQADDLGDPRTRAVWIDPLRPLR